ncbi:bifunctional 2-polyprenyl-6-hydroxyphenol methylase/3-demethylubiquinol 3-O-methyltransferase UbiG [Sutterella sp.]|uniref:class I SAM-dependent methyltransferase n=1 Tax=Sutterella sp. TaxID=1981025 RepID=UPI0026E0D978|nr:class I SAM-dependent methyltransferase [Sutterella sp.]MDO5532052.1 class I SAM-dependent methyltransferase [Sutterella sp.]
MALCKNEMQNCMQLPSAWLMRWLEAVRPGSRVLDVACGEGRHTSLMLMKGYRVTAVDRDLSFVRPLAGFPGLTLEKRDLESGPWPWGEGAFDAVLVTNYLHRPHFPDYFRTLAPGGLFIMETFTEVNTRIWGRPRNPDHYLLTGELLKLTPEGARVVAYEEGLTENRLGVARIVWMKPGDEAPMAVGLGTR